jgi:hypothetical protein
MPTKQRLSAEPPPFLEPQEVPNPTPPPPPTLSEEFTETRRVVGEPLKGEEIFTPTDEERKQFITLMSCGKRTKVIDVLGHSVGIESLNVDDDLRIGLFTKEYRESDAYARAVHIGTCAAGIRTVDGRLLYTPLSPDETSESIFAAKVDRLLKYYPVSITEIYREILNLDAEFGELALKLGKLKG